MNWGNKLVIVFVAFAALMITLVYKAVNTKFELVTKDYYKDELRYQDKIDGEANASAAGNIILLRDNASLVLQLPGVLSTSPAEGEAWFYCKTDESKDRKFQVKIENGKYIFDALKLAKADYELKLQLTSGNKKYYYTRLVSTR